LEAARVPGISLRRLSPSQPQFLAVMRSTPEPEQTVRVRMLHYETLELPRSQPRRLLVFVIETLKLGLQLPAQFRVKTLESRWKHLLRPRRRVGTSLRFFGLVSIPNSVRSLQRIWEKIADWKQCPLRMLGFLARFYPALWRQLISFRVRVLSVLGAVEPVSTPRPVYQVRQFSRAMRSA
jgi:hypothetical protein